MSKSTAMQVTKCVCAWEDEDGKWIVSQDEIDQHGNTLYTATVSVCETKQEAYAECKKTAKARKLPAYAYTYTNSDGYAKGNRVVAI